MDLELTIESAPALIHTGRPDGHLDFFNRTWLTYVGLPQEDLEGWKWTTAIHPDDLEAMLRAWRAALATGDPLLHEARVRRADGVFRWMLHHKIALRDERGAIVKWYGSSIDIEDRRRTEDALRASEERFRALVEHATDAFVLRDESGIVVDVNRQTCESLGYRRDELIGMHLSEIDPEADFSASWKRFDAGEPMITFESRHRRKDGTFFPVEVRTRRFKSSDGRQLALTLARDISERKRAEEKMGQQERKLREILDLVPHHIVVVAADGTRLYSNQALLDYYTLTIEDLQDSPNDNRRTMRQNTHPEDVETFVAAWERGFTGTAPWETEARFRRGDGQYRWFLVRSIPLHDDEGRIVHWYVTGTDIDDRKRAEEALQESEAHYRVLIEVSPQMVWTMSADGLNMQTNQWWYEYTGFTRPETEGLDSVHPEHRRQLWKSWRQAVASGGEWTAEAPFRRAADGQYRWHLLRGRPIRDAEGRIVRWMGIGIDIHDRRESEEALRRTEAWLSEAQRLSHTGSFAQNLDTGELVFVSPELLRIYGFDPAAGIPSQNEVLRRFHPEDRLRIGQDFERAAREKTGHSAEWRLVLPDGTMRYIESCVDPIFDAAGRPVELIGTTIDVTERKQAEQALRQSELRYRNIFEKVGVAIVEHDFSRLMARLGELKASGVRDFRRYLAEHPEFASEMLDLVRIKDVNEAAVALFGASSKEEYLAGSASRRRTREVRAAWVSQLLAVAEGRGSVEEVAFTTHRNETIHTLVSIVLPPESSGFESVLITIVDLSERKRAEQGLNQAQAALAHVTRVTTLGELTASIAHEVNQPLAAIVNNANASLSLLSHEPTDVEELRAALEDISSDAVRASAVIERVRSMAKRSPSEPAPLRLADVVDDVVALAAAESARRCVAIRSEVADDLRVVSGDRVQLQQVLLNLVVNAMDAMASVPESERLLEIRARSDVRDGRPAVSVSVRDHGVGLEDTDLYRLFDAFYSTKPHGMGMGLAISRSIIDAHGGDLWAEANQGPGATFSFCLPAAPERPES